MSSVCFTVSGYLRNVFAEKVRRYDSITLPRFTVDQSGINTGIIIWRTTLLDPFALPLCPARHSQVYALEAGPARLAEVAAFQEHDDIVSSVAATRSHDELVLSGSHDRR